MPESATALATLHVVPHTHWDREWYRPFESYRYRLVKTIDAVLEADLPYFLLDGQTAVVDDYLAIRPEAEAELRRRIAAGSVGVGPWYVLVDEFLVSGESLVRNLLVGRAAMRRLGASQPVGYLPDMFGHIAQMPQILRGFGLDTAVVWRGANPGSPRFSWVGPDGSAVATAWLPLGYYQPMFLEAQSPQARDEQLRKYLEGFGRAESVLLLSGADHMAPRADLESQLEAVNRSGLPVSARISSLAEAIAGPAPEVVVEGELRDCSKAYLLPGVLSARTYLKQANARCQTLLEQYAEPLATLGWLGGRAYPQPFLAHAWRELMKNHPHDSICGCSIDQVHREMMPRFAAVEQVGAEVLADAVARFTRPRANPTVAVFNPTGWPYAGWVETTVEWPLAEAPEAIALASAAGEALPTVLIEREDGESFCAEIDFNPDWFPVRRFRVAVRLELPAASALTLAALPVEPDAPAPAVAASATHLENGSVALRVEAGRVSLLDKRSGRRFEDVHHFLDEGDAGDEYNFSPLAGDAPIKSTIVGSRLLEARQHRAVLEVSYALTVPRGLSADRSRRADETVTLDLTSRFTLEADSAMVAVETRLDQRARDHRLRVVVPAGERDRPAVWSEGTFGVFRREPASMPELPVPKGTEAPMPEFPQGRFTALVGQQAGLAVANEGLPEAAVIESAAGWALAVTLVRAVGWLSRDDLSTRGGGAGPRFETPEAQCPGEQVFRYALLPIGTDWREALAPAHQFAAPPRAWVAEGLAIAGPTVELGDDRVVLSALKRSEEGDRVVVRAYNAGPEPLEATMRVHLPHGRILEADLAEEPGAAVGRGEVRYRMRPYEIKTWLIERA